MDAAAWRPGATRSCPRPTTTRYLASLMRPVQAPASSRRWIAPPKVGIDNKPGDFEYVKIET